MASGVQIGSLAVGTSVYANVNGVRKEFIIVHQGNPDAINIYDSSCDGTWLLMKDLYESKQLHGENTGFYNTTNIHIYLNIDFYGLLDQDIKKAIKSVKIPYVADRYKVVNKKEYGLSAKVFLLSAQEVSATNITIKDGNTLSYFSTAGDSERIAYLSGKAKTWWLRTTDSSGIEYEINTYGALQSSAFAAYRGIRPACIVYPETLVDTSDYSILGLPSKKHKTLIGGTGYEITGGRTMVGGTGYDIKKGRTLIGGTGYDIPFANTVNIKTRGVADYSRLGYWIEVDGERIYKTGEYKIRAGSTLRFFTSNNGSVQPSTTDANDVVIYLNGTKVKQTYFGSLRVDANDYGYSTVYLHYYDYILENDITVSKTAATMSASAKLYIVEE